MLVEEQFTSASTRRRIPLAHLTICVLFFGTGCSALADQTPGKPTETNSIAMTATKDSVFTIDLACAAGRGFSWQLADPVVPTNVQFIKQTFDNGPTDKDGANGIQRFHFKAIASGTSNLKFIYVQPFRKPYPKDVTTTNVSVTIK